MTRLAKLLAVSFALILFLPQVAGAQVTSTQAASIGEIRSARDAKIIRAGAELVASVGVALVEKDILVTGASGGVGLVLNDNSVITLGPLTLFKLSEFTFRPQENRLGIFGEIYSGTMEYISGKISRMARDAAKFRTPYTTVAARGTRMLIRGDE